MAVRPSMGGQERLSIFFISCLPWVPFTPLHLLSLFMWMLFAFSFLDSDSHTIYLTDPVPSPSSNSHLPQEGSSSSCFSGKEKLDSPHPHSTPYHTIGQSS